MSDVRRAPRTCQAPQPPTLRAVVESESMRFLGWGVFTLEVLRLECHETRRGSDWTRRTARPSVLTHLGLVHGLNASRIDVGYWFQPKRRMLSSNVGVCCRGQTRYTSLQFPTSNTHKQCQLSELGCDNYWLRYLQSRVECTKSAPIIRCKKALVSD